MFFCIQDCTNVRQFSLDSPLVVQLNKFFDKVVTLFPYSTHLDAGSETGVWRGGVNDKVFNNESSIVIALSQISVWPPGKGVYETDVSSFPLLQVIERRFFPSYHMVSERVQFIE